MNASDPRCQTALGRTLCAILHAEPPPALERDSDHERIRPPSGPHNALECRILAGSMVLLATLHAARLLAFLPWIWRLPLALAAAPLVLQSLALFGVLLTRPLPEKHRPAAISHFLLIALSVSSLTLLPFPWTRWPATAWLLLCILNLGCAAGERIGAHASSTA